MATIYSQQYMKTITMADINSALSWNRQKHVFGLSN